MQGTTPEFIRWALAHECPLRDFPKWKDPNKTERHLRAIRVYQNAVQESRVLDGIAIEPLVSSDVVPNEVLGFRVDDVFEFESDPANDHQRYDHGHARKDCPGNEVGRENRRVPTSGLGHREVPGDDTVDGEDQRRCKCCKEAVRLHVVAPLPIRAAPAQAHGAIDLRDHAPRPVAEGREVGNEADVEEDGRDCEVGRDRENVPHQRRLEVLPELTLVGVGEQPVGIPHSANVNRWEECCSHDGKDRHGLSGSVNASTPL